jgi:hypothetical protein
MATNVFLVFWYGYDAQQLRRLEKWYLLFAYGIPMVPPMVYVIMDHHSQTRVLGSATVCQLICLTQPHANCAALVLGHQGC